MSKSNKRRSGQRVGPRMDRALIRALLSRIPGNTSQDRVEALIVQVVHGAEDAGGDLAALAAYDLDPHVSGAAGLFLFRGLSSERLAPLAKGRLAEGAVPTLLRALRDPSLPDDRKFPLPTLLKLAGRELSDEEVQGCFKDIAGALNRTFVKATSRLSDQPRDVMELLTQLRVLNEDGTAPAEDDLANGLESCAAARDTHPSLFATALAAMVILAAEHRLASGLIGQVPGTIAAIRSERAAWCLSELGRWPGLGDAGANARALAAQLAAVGIAPRFALPDAFSHGLLSAIDGDGMRHLSLYFDTPEESVAGVLFLLSDCLGVKTVTFVPEDAEDMYQQLREDLHQIPDAPCTVELAREFIAHAWAIQDERQRPLSGEFFVVRPYLGSEAIIPRRRTPDLSAYHFESMIRSPDLAKGSQRLLEFPEYGALYLIPDGAYDVIAGLNREAGRPVSREDFEAFARDIAVQERGTLLARMAANLELETIAGRADQPINRLAARTWLAISENLVPFHEIPYIRGLCKESIEMVTHNLDLGYHNQDDANRASMAMDQAFRRRLGEAFGGPDQKD